MLYTNHPRKWYDWAPVTIFAYTTVNFEKFCHGTRLSKFNNTVDSGPLLLASTTVDANDAIHYGSRSIVLICYVFVANLCV